MDATIEQISGNEVKPVTVSKSVVPIVQSNSKGDIKIYFKQADGLVKRFKEIFKDSEEEVINDRVS